MPVPEPLSPMGGGELPPFIARLTAEMRQGLPGRAAQRQMTPELAYGRHQGPFAAAHRRAGVLALLYPVEQEWVALTTLRPMGMRAHGGQVCFPGGEVEADEQAPQTALRELAEELAIDPLGVRLIGPLTPVYVFVSNFKIEPFLAWAPHRPAMQPNPLEVAEVLEAPLAALLDPAARGEHWIERRGLRFRAPHFECRGRRIWGATSLMLAEVAELTRRAGLADP